jgi:hypothetical protein
MLTKQVSRARRSAQRCAADPGPSQASAAHMQAPVKVPHLQCIVLCTLHCVRDTR